MRKEGIKKSNCFFTLCGFLICGILVFYFNFKDRYYAKVRYPDGKVKKTSIYLPLKKVFRVKEFYPDGELESIFYVNSTGDYQVGEGKIYSKNGKLKAINYLDDGHLYFKRIFDYDANGNLVDSGETLLPVVREFKLNKGRDTAIIKVQVLIEGTKYRYEDLDLYYEVYDTIRPDGLFPYTPTGSTTFNGPEVKTLFFPIEPIAKNAKKYYLAMVIREKVNGRKEEHEPVIKEIDL